MLKILKNQNGFAGLIGIIIAIVAIGIMSAMILPTFTAKMQYKQAKYTVGVIKTIENAENAYLAKNPGGFADLTTLASQGYLSSNFLQSVQVGFYPQPNWVNTQIANKTVALCISNGSGCPNNPGVGTNGYFIGIYNIPANYQTYIEHELPGSGRVGIQDVSYVAPIPSSPPVAKAQNANYANSAGYANSSGYANTAGYANSSGYANTAGYAKSTGPVALSALESAQPSFQWPWYYNPSQYYAIYEMVNDFCYEYQNSGRCLTTPGCTATYYEVLIAPGQRIPTSSSRSNTCNDKWIDQVSVVGVENVFSG